MSKKLIQLTYLDIHVNISSTLPASLLQRSHSIFIYLRQNFQKNTQKFFSASLSWPAQKARMLLLNTDLGFYWQLPCWRRVSNRKIKNVEPSIGILEVQESQKMTSLLIYPHFQVQLFSFLMVSLLP